VEESHPTNCGNWQKPKSDKRLLLSVQLKLPGLFDVGVSSNEADDKRSPRDDEASDCDRRRALLPSSSHAKTLLTPVKVSTRAAVEKPKRRRHSLPRSKHGSLRTIRWAAQRGAPSRESVNLGSSAKQRRHGPARHDRDWVEQRSTSFRCCNPTWTELPDLTLVK
jgi:hypothetical protein